MLGAETGEGETEGYLGCIRVVPLRRAQMHLLLLFYKGTDVSCGKLHMHY